MNAHKALTQAEPVTLLEATQVIISLASETVVLHGELSAVYHRLRFTRPGSVHNASLRDSLVARTECGLDSRFKYMRASRLALAVKDGLRPCSKCYRESA